MKTQKLFGSMILAGLPFALVAAGGCSTTVTTTYPDAGGDDGGLTFPDTGLGQADTGIGNNDSSILQDTGTTTDTGITPFEAGGDSGGDSGAPSCYVNAPFTPIPWGPPSPLHQNKCMPAMITAFINAINAGMNPTSGDMNCDACLITQATAATHGPVVVSGMNAAANYGGCAADFDMMTAAGSCGDLYDSINECIFNECGTCSDFNGTGMTPITDACVQASIAMGAPCANYVPTKACFQEFSTGGDAGVGVASTCGPTFQNLITLWCGM